MCARASVRGEAAGAPRCGARRDVALICPRKTSGAEQWLRQAASCVCLTDEMARADRRGARAHAGLALHTAPPPDRSRAVPAARPPPSRRAPRVVVARALGSGWVPSRTRPPKGILRPSSLGAPRGDASSTPRGDDDPPTMPGRADAAVTTTFDAFHDRVGAVFANLGPGLRDAPAPPAWMPSNTSVVRAGRPVAPPRDDDAHDARDDDAEEATFSSDDDDADAAAPRDPSERSSSAAAPSSPPVDLGDLDCLGSDVEAEPGDDSEAMRRMRRSVGRCDALDAEEEYDRFDDVALGGGRDAFADASDAKAAVRTSPPNAKAAASAGSAERFEDALRRRSANKRRRAETSRGVAWAASVPEDDAPGATPGRGAFGGGGGDAKKNPGPGALLSSSASWVPDHVRHPDRYTCYTLDEPLLIGGGGRSTGGASLKGARRKAAEAVSVSGSGSGSGPGSVAAEAAAEAEAAPLERPIFRRPEALEGRRRRRRGRGFFLRRRVVRGGRRRGSRATARAAPGSRSTPPPTTTGGRRRGRRGRSRGGGGGGRGGGRRRSDRAGSFARAGGRGRAEERAEAARGRGRGRVRGGDACSHRWTDAPGALF